MDYKSFSKGKQGKFANIKMLKVPEYHKKDQIESNETFLRESIKEFDIQAPLIVNTYPGREGVIINGTQVYKECLDQGIRLIPVWEVSVNLNVEKKLHGLLNTHKTDLSIEHLKTLLGMCYVEFFPEVLLCQQQEQGKMQALIEETMTGDDPYITVGLSK